MKHKKEMNVKVRFVKGPGRIKGGRTGNFYNYKRTRVFATSENIYIVLY